MTNIDIEETTDMTNKSIDSTIEWNEKKIEQLKTALKILDASDSFNIVDESEGLSATIYSDRLGEQIYLLIEEEIENLKEQNKYWNEDRN